MTDDEQDEAGSEGRDGVFGNLPNTRPGSRSPRRDPDQADAPAPESVAKERPAPPPPPPPPEEPPALEGAHREPTVERRPGEEQGIRSVEDLAWAGVAVAAQAATVGVRLASRALDAARKSIDRP